MAINIVSPTIDQLVQSIPKPFTSHTLISILIKNHKTEWEELVNSYTGNRLVQEQRAVQQIGRYLVNNAKRLEILQGRTIKDNTIEGLINHNPQETTEWLQMP